MSMKVKDLMTLLGESIAELHCTSYKDEAFDGALKRAEYEAKLAKQFINGADITLRTDKMAGRTDRIDEII